HIIVHQDDMPRVNGLEALKILKENDQFRKIPVIGFSTTEDPQKIQQFYQAGATAYIIKSIDFSGLAEALKSIEDFWFQIVRLPDPNTY
ncbi:MAG: response regulator, partial [Bacteroidota bacterium]